MSQGRIIEYIEQGKFACTLCLQDKGTRLHLLTSSNREVNIPSKRALLITGSTVDTALSREQLLETLKAIEETRTRLKARVDVQELWELIKDEKESFDHRYLAQLAFGMDITDDHLSALVRALFEDRLYFKMKDGRFRANDGERVEQIIRQRKEEALLETKLRQGSVWLSAILRGEGAEEPEAKEEIVDALVRVVLHGANAPEFKFAKDLLSLAGVRDITKARDVLVALDIWEQDENLDLLRLGVSASFSDDQLQEASLIAQKSVSLESYQDLTHVPVLTIDGPYTKDFDDALSIERDGDSLLVGVHIADVAGMVEPGSILDKEAAQRASSQYYPRKQIPMFPPELSQDAMSLKQGCVRRAISLLARFGPSGDLRSYEFVPSLVRVERQLTYDEVDMSVESDTALSEMRTVGRRLKNRRMEAGGLDLTLPEPVLTVREDGAVALELVEQNKESRLIVEELMILYNWLAARLCRENNIPTLFRCQAQPSQVFSHDEEYLFYVFRQRRKLSPLRLEFTPSPHSGLGLDVYVQATSPIRRYLDLVVQRQIRNFLLHQEAPFDEERLEEIRMGVEPVTRELALVKRQRVRYWMLKYLQQNRGKTCSALVLDELKSKYRLVLRDYMLVAEMKKQNGLILTPGEGIEVEVRNADAWTDRLELAYVERT